MNELENAGILNWRGWFFARKAQVIGALVGASVTIAMPLIVHLYGSGPSTFLFLWL